MSLIRSQIRLRLNYEHSWLFVDDAPTVSLGSSCFTLTLHEALDAFAQIAPRQAKVVELRYFGGLSDDETAEVMKTSPRTVRRDWQFARAWLQHELNS